MNKKSKIISSVLVLLSFVLILGTVSAYRGDVNVTGNNYDPVVHQNIRNSIEQGDYQAWYSLVSVRDNNSRITDHITKDNFEEYSLAYMESVSGNSTLLEQFRLSLGLGQGQQMNKHNIGSFGKSSNSTRNSGIKEYRQNRGVDNTNCIYN
jgi:hypothetical protein